MYQFFQRVKECYQLLQDELSRNIFRARLNFEFDPLPQNMAQLVRLGEQQKWLDKLHEEIPQISQTVNQCEKKLVLYGTNVTGQMIASDFLEKGIEFYGFCGRRAKEFKNGLLGKPVISPDFLLEHKNDFYIIITAGEAIDEILGFLVQNQFPQGQILSSFKPQNEIDHQYFDFPSFFPRGTAFVDGGCLDCRTSYRFADWCKGDYSKIFAFEPDPISCRICEQNLAEKPLHGFKLIQAGLSDHDGEVSFRAGLYGCSHVMPADGADTEHLETVSVTTIDKVVGGERVGFIKLDIEGSEYDALHGAKNTIVRDKPLLALSVYHVPGDMLAIMDYLHGIVSEYRFWLRHYSIGAADTVLYASTDNL